MVKLEKVLCPVDFSDCAQLALDYALALAKEQRAEIAVMHVLPEVFADPDLYPYLSEPVVPEDKTRERALHQLGSFVHRAREQRLASDVILEDGDIVEEILRRAARLPADLVVMGTHGRRGFSRLLLGSVTERVLRQAPCPVLSVSPVASGPSKEGSTFQRILCPVDFQTPSLDGLRMALALAGDGSEVTVVHVVEFYMDPGVGEATPFDLSEIREHHQRQAMTKLEASVPAEARDRVRLETAVLDRGGVHRQILRLAEREKSQLIVMGVAGRSAADLLFFGSTTNHVVRSASCPVLTIRSRESS